MIGKVITLNKSGAAKGGFCEAVGYIARDAPDEGRALATPLMPDDLGVTNLMMSPNTPEDRMNIWSAMNATALQARRFRGNPVYHLAINWMEGEHPVRHQVEHAVMHVMKALEMDECEAIWAIHRDTDTHHVHLIINRVHPVRGIVVGPPRFDYFVIDRAMREIELAQGWLHAPGPYVVNARAGAEPEIVRLSRSKRLALGLLRSRETPAPEAPVVRTDIRPVSQRAYRAARNQGAPSFQEWVGGEPAQALVGALQAPDVTWASIHQTLALYGLSLQTRGSGMVITTDMNGRVLAVKASQLGRWASKGALEKKLGAFTPALKPDVRVAEKGYTMFVENAQQGRSDSREAMRDARAEARTRLQERFRLEQQTLISGRKEARATLLKKQKRVREILYQELRRQRKEYLAAQRATGVRPKNASSLWPYIAARSKESLQLLQAHERRELAKDGPGGEVWRRWLTLQAEQGDEAAKSALRGLRYREQRQKNKEKDGLEGEDQEVLRPVLTGLKVQLDDKKMRIYYRSEDGRSLFTDLGSRIDVHDRAHESLEAALRVAAQKFGGAVSITGSSEFRTQAARMAIGLGVGVRDQDLKYFVEQEKVFTPGWSGKI